jgi:hypothetical protein
MLTAVLNWLRRGLALVILAGLCLPLVTVHGCKNDAPITYTGWEAVEADLFLLSIPLFAVGVVVMTLFGRRPATAVGRLILVLVRLAWSGLAGGWSGIFIELLPPGFDKDAHIGAWVICGAWLGIVLADLADLARRGRAWNRWRGGREFTVLDDDMVRIVGWGMYVSGGCVALAVMAAYAHGQLKGIDDLHIHLFAHGALLLFLAWWTLACLAGWGLQRGLRWAFVLQCIGGAGAVLVAGLALVGAVYSISQGATLPTRVDDNLVPLGVAILAALWLAWTFWSLGVTVLRYRLFVRTPPEPEPLLPATRG